MKRVFKRISEGWENLGGGAVGGVGGVGAIRGDENKRVSLWGTHSFYNNEKSLNFF